MACFSSASTLRMPMNSSSCALIAARFVPLIPFNAVCYAAGITHVPRPRYAWTTAIGIAPSSLAIWMAANPTLLEAAVITTKSPGRTAATSTNAP